MALPENVISAPANDKVGGVSIDRNLTQNDAFGDTVQWLAT